MRAAEIIAAVGYGGLLAVAGLTLWGDFRDLCRLDRAAVAIRWVAAIVLLLSILLDVFRGRGLSVLLFLASVGAPAHGPARRVSRWCSSLSIAPALALTGVSLFTDSGLWADQQSWRLFASVRGVAFLGCGAIGVRALAAHLMHLQGPTRPHGKSSVITYFALTLLVGGLTMTSLWQRGMLWDQSAEHARLALAWLVLTAARMMQRKPLRVALMLVGTGSLIWTVASIR